ncbi:hypothetical protein AALO_G00233020 [Alosa alosa]|uniref:Ribosomal biogenesis protein LAS1L n=1 Tax=Alosa alosa TaxID=278164 RepID=A0AAV6FUT2_9TELE|nr:ribosomal biogenesis protein LAS1L [Alosa alosa]KAG5266520.1 hypothetical protein AALO_G00233020 [Alosa alosa]
MKNKPATKMRHVVAWMNKAEWDQVLDYLYSKDAALQNHALQRISAWKGRFGHNTPVAVESTADLVRCQVLDNSGQLDSDDLVLLYGMALVRFVNLITERKQGRVAKPLRRLAGHMNIPEWIVNLRHDLTHRRLPSLKWCRKGCAFVLQWLQQEYWSRQLGSRLAEDWDSDSEEDDESWARRREEELLTRQKETENHKKARELLISYEKERFQMFEEWLRHGSPHGAWLEPSADLSWILKQIKLFATDSREILTDTLLQDGFLIPTPEQLESLDIDLTGCYDPLRPCVPRVFLQFWLPLLKALNKVTFIRRVLEKLFVELSVEPDPHRSYYLSGWISEVVLCNSKSLFKVKKKSQMMELFVNRMQLGWQQLLTACLNSPCTATPYLLQLLLKDMDEPPPPDTQEKLLRLCSIYTQGEYNDNEDTRGHHDPSKPVYTLQNLKERLRHSNSAHGRRAGPSLSNHSALSAQSLPTEDLQEKLSASVLEERQAALRGSPWQVCTDKVPWKFYPLGKVPGQSEDPSFLMVETYSTLAVFDQQVELDKAPQHHINPSIHGQNRTGSDGQLWSLAELNKLKSGLKLF